MDEILILILLMKLMTKEKALLVEAIDQGLEQLIILANSEKAYLFPYLKDVFAVMIQDVELGRKTYDKINEVTILESCCKICRKSTLLLLKKLNKQILI